MSIWNGYLWCDCNLFDGQWHHVAAVLGNDGSPTMNEVKVYIDGILQVPTFVNPATSINTSANNDVLMGAFMEGTVKKYYFKGLLDDVRVYNWALSDGEIADLAQ